MTQSNLQYCWMFNHPIAGWCGGTDESEWVDVRSVVDRNALFCQWETKIVSREYQKIPKARPGSVSPSIRKDMR